MVTSAQFKLQGMGRRFADHNIYIWSVGRLGGGGAHPLVNLSLVVMPQILANRHYSSKSPSYANTAHSMTMKELYIANTLNGGHEVAIIAIKYQHFHNRNN